MNTLILINGDENQHISALDRGLSYGDGLFETLLVHEGTPIFLGEHLDRLDLGCHKLGLPTLDHQIWTSDIQRLINDEVSGSLKLIYTRGIGPRGFAPPSATNPTRVVQFQPGPNTFCQSPGLRVRLCSHPLSIQPALAGIKHLNQLDRVLARSEWTGTNPEEGIMFDPNGHAIEGTMSNLFVIEQDTIYTPDLDQCGIAGIIRDQVFKLAAQFKIPCQIAQINRSMLHDADEMFMTNSLIGIAPVIEYELQPKVGGPITIKLQKALLDQSNHYPLGS